LRILTSRTLAKRWAKHVEAAAPAYESGVANPRSGKPREARIAASRYAWFGPKKKSAWARGWEPYRKILLGLKLPPRGERNSAANFERSRIVAEALHTEKVRREQTKQNTGSHAAK
jgi:hypothetical protein